MLETNIDDMTGEALGYAMEKLFEAGALDVYFIPITMKKNRPGIILSALCKLEDAARLKKLIFLNTSTFGIRETPINRDVLDRDFIEVEVSGETIRCKVGIFEGKVIKVLPEYEDCRTAAIKTGAGFSDIYQQAVAKSREYSVFF
nr:nickel insertion protein [Lutispora saccharofermentans]